MSNVYIYDGKFYKEGKLVAPVFGDIEQIQVLKKNNDLLECYKTDGLEYYASSNECFDEFDEDSEVWSQINLMIKCVCGRKPEANTDAWDEDDYEELSGTIIYCDCGRNYEVEHIIGNKFNVKLQLND
jgi:YHS domain-containing protein